MNRDETDLYDFLSPSSGKTASGESGQNNGGIARGKGIGSFAEGMAKSERSRAKDSSPWFCLVCGVKARCGKEAFLLT